MKYDGEEHRGEEGTRYDNQERQQEDRFEEEEETEDDGMSRGHHRSGSEPDNGTDKTHRTFRDGLEDEHVRTHANDSPEDSAVGNFHYDPPMPPRTRPVLSTNIRRQRAGASKLTN